MGKPELTRHSQADARRFKFLRGEIESRNKLVEPRFSQDEWEIRQRKRIGKRTAITANIQKERTNSNTPTGNHYL